VCPATSELYTLSLHGALPILQVALLAVTAGYFVISWRRGGQTIGMRAWRIRIVATEGGALPWSRALLRFAVALVSLGALGLGFRSEEHTSELQSREKLVCRLL